MRAWLPSSRQLLSCGSPCPGQLKSNSPRLMDEAVLALQNLVRQCSDSSAMEALARHLFAILGGGQVLPGHADGQGVASGIPWVPGPVGGLVL